MRSQRFAAVHDGQAELEQQETVRGWPEVARTVWRSCVDRRVALRLLLATGVGVLAAASGVALVAASAWLISRAAGQPPILLLLVAIVAVRAFGLGRAVFRYVERLLAHDAALRALARLRVRVFDGLEASIPRASAADGVGFGDLVTRLVRDVEALPDLLLRVLLPGLVLLAVGLGTAAMVGLLLPAAGVVLAIALLVVVTGVPGLAARGARRAGRRVAPARAELAERTREVLVGAPDLLAYQAAEGAVADMAAADHRLRRAEARSAWGTGLGEAVVVIVTGTACWAALAFGVDAVDTGTLDPVLLAVVVLTPLALADVLAGLPVASATAVQAKAALTRITRVLSDPSPTPVTGRATGTAVDHRQPRAVPWALRVDGLAARWSADGLDVFTDVDFEVRPGRRVAVVGPSGSGKSTLAQVLVGFLAPSRGRVLLDDVDLAALSGTDVRRVVGLCTQLPYVFDTTLAENLRLARPDASDAELRDVLGRTRLLDWVETLPHGLHTPAGEHGARLSGGERQRLALARCLLADTPIVVLDEPTEHVDTATADVVIAELLDASHDRGVVLITHRRADLARVDTVVELPVREMPSPVDTGVG